MRPGEHILSVLPAVNSRTIWPATPIERISETGRSKGAFVSGVRNTRPAQRHLMSMRSYVAMDAHLVQLIREGDTHAFADLISLHDGEMLRVAAVICRDGDMAEDAVQQAWKRAWRQLGTIRDPDRVRAWLVAVAANEARQIVRSEGRRSRRERAYSGQIAHNDIVDSVNERLHLDAVLAALDVRDRELLALRYVAGLNATEIAGLRQSSPGAVRSRLARLIARLREELSDA